MPEITEAQHAEYRRYQQFGTPDEVDGKIKESEKVKGENASLREKKRALEAKVPAEGATVLTGDDAKRWDAFQALGKTPEELAAGLVMTADERKKWEAFAALDVKPEDIPAIVEENKTLKDKDAERTRLDTLAAVVEAMGWPKETTATIADMKSLDEATFEVKKEKSKDGAGADVEANVAYVTVKGGQPVKFAEFAAQTDALKGIRTTGDKAEGGAENRWMDQTTRGTSGGYDAAKAGREMAEKQKASTGTTNLALT